MKYAEQLPLDKGIYKIIVDDKDNALHLLIRDGVTMVFPDVWSWGAWVKRESSHVIHNVVLTEDLGALYNATSYDWRDMAGILDIMSQKYIDNTCERIVDMLEHAEYDAARAIYRSMSIPNREKVFDWISVYYYYDMEDRVIDAENIRATLKGVDIKYSDDERKEWVMEATNKLMKFLRQSDYKHYLTDADMAVITADGEEGFDRFIVQYGLWLVTNS
jgi:hypothetical protein